MLSVYSVVLSAQFALSKKIHDNRNETLKSSYQLDASQRRVLQPSDLPFDEQLERDLGHEERGPRPGRIADRGQDVHAG